MQTFRTSLAAILTVVMLSISLLPAVAQEGDEVLTVYSGRSESLIQPILDQFTEETGVNVEVRYGDTAGLATQLIEEGENTPADVYIAQDGGALGAVANAGLFDTLPSDVVNKSREEFSSPDDLWVGISGRARVLIFNPQLVAEQELELPDSIFDLTSEEYQGQVGWSPTNGSFQANVTAMRVLEGDERTLEWLEGMVANDAVPYPGNTPMNQAVIDGEIAMGITNHYYMFRFLEENPDAPIEQYFFPGGDAGSLINVAGAGVLSASDQPGLSQRLLLYLLGETAQQYFVDSTFEYPVIPGIDTNERITPLEDIESPNIDLSNLEDLQGTIDLIEQSGALDN